MKKSTIIGLCVLVIAIIALIIWGFPIVSDRYSDFKSDKAAQEEQAKSDADSTDTLETEDGDMPEEDAPETTDDDLAGEGDEFLQISTADCNNGCKEYTDTEDLTYCKQVCGLSAVNEKANGCDALEDELEKDYCFKDLAISKKDLATCDKIEDSGIKKTCKNRITEDLLESSDGVPAL